MLSEYKRNIILFNVQQNVPLETIRQLDQLKSPDGKLIRMDTLKYWVKRIETTGGVEPKKATGRPEGN